MNFFTKLATLFSIPLMIINLLGGIVSFIWLAVLGEWSIIGYGIAGLVFSTFGIGLAMMPALLLIMPAAALYEKGSKFGFYIFSFLGTLYTITVLCIWCLGVLFFFAKLADSSSFIPVLLWSYGIATGPIASMAQKEQNDYAFISTFFAQIAYILVLIIILFSRVSLLDVSIIFGVIMFIGLIIQFTIASQIERAEQESR